MRTSLKVSSPSLTETEYLSFLLHYAFENHYAAAVWRLPNDAVTHLILSRRHQVIPRDTVIEDLPTGFIFAPFERQKDSVFLQADYSFSFIDQQLKAPETPLEETSAAWLNTQLPEQFPVIKVPVYPSSDTYFEVGEDGYIEMVKAGILDIEQGKFEKVVPSRTKRITLPGDFNVVEAFRKLCDAYTNALVSYVSAPETGTWMGATPELLVSVENREIFRTIALAGTQPFIPGTNLRTVAWTQKEIEEQALVERYIISCFKKIRLREYDEHGPKTVVAGNLMHLRSDFTVNMKETNFPQLGTAMLQLLHPTSAVCGMPLEPSHAFLHRHEGYDRSFYSGFLGPVNHQHNINLFVNLRCMQLQGDKAYLYAGAGVTIDSIPEKEWDETEIKLNTLRKVIL